MSATIINVTLQMGKSQSSQTTDFYEIIRTAETCKLHIDMRDQHDNSMNDGSERREKLLKQTNNYLVYEAKLWSAIVFSLK